MVNKSDALYGHPGNILGQIGNHQETGLFIFFENPGKQHIKHAGDSSPPDKGISHTAYRADLIGAYDVVRV